MILLIIFVYAFPLYRITVTHTQYYIKANGTEVFNYFAEKYKRHYENEAERQRSLKNYIKNLNSVDTLNEQRKNNSTLFIANMYADMDTEDFEERYAIPLKPYYDLRDPKESELLRNQKRKNTNGNNLYDLMKADELYSKFMMSYGKKNATKKKDREAHYYRFLKTLIQLNRNNFENEENRTLDETADVLKEPDEYFY